MKTAIDWFSEQYNSIGTSEHKQAKEMYKQQIINTILLSANYQFKDIDEAKEWFEKYYNETYGKEI